MRMFPVTPVHTALTHASTSCLRSIICTGKTPATGCILRGADMLSLLLDSSTIRICTMIWMLSLTSHPLRERSTSKPVERRHVCRTCLRGNDTHEYRPEGAPLSLSKTHQTWRPSTPHAMGPLPHEHVMRSISPLGPPRKRRLMANGKTEHDSEAASGWSTRKQQVQEERQPPQYVQHVMQDPSLISFSIRFDFQVTTTGGSRESRSPPTPQALLVVAPPQKKEDSSLC
jgi:hypothetical protein